MNKFIGTLGLAIRARKTMTGEQVLISIRNQSAKLVLISDECGANTRKKLLDKCSFYHVPHAFISDADIAAATGQGNRKAIAILDKGFAEALLNCLKG